MEDIGIKVEHIALMYAVLPFTIFLAPPLVGYMADKLGSYTRVLILTLFGSGVFHTVLLFLPSVQEIVLLPQTSHFEFEGNLTTFEWSKCKGDICSSWAINPQEKMQLDLDECTLDCPIDVGICEAVTNMFMCQSNGTQVTFRDVKINPIKGMYLLITSLIFHQFFPFCYIFHPILVNFNHILLCPLTLYYR